MTRRETYRNTASLRETGGRPTALHQRLRSSTPVAHDYAKQRKRSPPHTSKPIRADMVRRMDIAPRLINPMGMPARTVTMDTQDSEPHAISTARLPNIHIAEETDLHHRLRSGTRSSSPHGPRPSMEVGFGGFPGPREIISSVASKAFPTFHRSLQQTLTMPRTSTLVPQNRDLSEIRQPAGPTRRVQYLSFIADVEKNSHFHHLTEEQMLELGGVEYRALNCLLWITPLVSAIYHLFCGRF